MSISSINGHFKKAAPSIVFRKVSSSQAEECRRETSRVPNRQRSQSFNESGSEVRTTRTSRCNFDSRNLSPRPPRIGIDCAAVGPGGVGCRQAARKSSQGWHSFSASDSSPELRSLRRLRREYPDLPYVFVTERRGPLSASAVRVIVSRAGEMSGFNFPVHPHMLRHATGYKLANDGHDTRAIQQYLGHKNIQHTVRYTQLSAARFRDLWKD